MFKIKRYFFSFHGRKAILDAAAKPISTEAKDLIFSAITSSIIQLKTKLHVFLANNTSEEVCDYTVKGSWCERSCAVYAGDSSTIVAQMHKKFSVQSILIGKDKFMVTVYPNIDYAFIVALIIILDEINSQNDGISIPHNDMVSVLSNGSRLVRAINKLN
ncbi:hypothetical protein Pfo_029049 [Paulownia fortunei]|nr:hypothetical protein Pfo_029049 [Paulownia fortunei]